MSLLLIAEQIKQAGKQRMNHRQEKGRQICPIKLSGISE